ncbi:hypothetical protein HY29_12190 [Hyphomonas beringensis]|uniref:N-acetyltransferase domain-containing protein n=1 Tax=Hyphomonas beringensis TaxID=1280946 RepID=A0A062U557_9PROT|nr:GNAT family protein [Hyphomonas beringensis]KCZ55476.1 hypothetical protein HY29_12190 [Hyphomonas beringensis]
MPPRRKDTVLVSERLVITPARKSDFEDWSELRKSSRKHLERWEPLWSKDANSRADWTRRTHAWKNGWKSGRAFVFLIRRLKDDRLVGGISLTNVRPWPASAASMGYWLGKDFQGHGYMAEGVGAVCQWSFSELGLYRIEAGILASNLRSRKVLETNGFQEEGHAKAYLEIAGERRDHVLFALVRPDS